MDTNSLSDMLKAGLRSLYSQLTSDEIELAIGNACRETGWALPIADTDKYKCLWTYQRAKRWCLDAILSESAYKFDFKQAKLSNRFDQLFLLVGRMDDEFSKEVDNNAAIFSGLETYKLFGTYASSGIAHDPYGKDITDEPLNEVLINGQGRYLYAYRMRYVWRGRKWQA